MSYAAAVSTPRGTVRQPEIKAQALSDADSRASSEAPRKPQRPGAGTRARTSFRGWSKKTAKGQHGPSKHQPGPVEEVPHTGHYPRIEHKPQTQNEEELVYILTMKLSDSLARSMNEMRERYFPTRLNRIPAHLTLFHALPHSQMEVLEQSIRQTSESMQPFVVSTGKPFRMRKGVGVNVDSGYHRMKEVHRQLQMQWETFLSEQDAGGFRPHWTVMNKVDDAELVDGAFETIGRGLLERNEEGRALGLDLWRYNRGDWEWVKEFPFGSTSPASRATELHSGRNGAISVTQGDTDGGAPGGQNKRPGLWTRGSSVGDVLRTMSFGRKSS